MTGGGAFPATVPCRTRQEEVGVARHKVPPLTGTVDRLRSRRRCRGVSPIAFSPRLKPESLNKAGLAE